MEGTHHGMYFWVARAPLKNKNILQAVFFGQCLSNTIGLQLKSEVNLYMLASLFSFHVLDTIFNKFSMSKMSKSTKI